MTVKPKTYELRLQLDEQDLLDREAGSAAVDRLVYEVANACFKRGQQLGSIRGDPQTTAKSLAAEAARTFSDLFRPTST